MGIAPLRASAARSQDHVNVSSPLVSSFAWICHWLLAVSFCVFPADAQSHASGDQIRILTDTHTNAAYTLALSDCGKLLSFANSSGVSVTIPAIGAAGLPAGCWMDLQNTGTAPVTLTAANATIDGAASVTLNAAQGLRLVTGASNYLTQRGQASSAAAVAVQSVGVPLGTASTLDIETGVGVTCIPQINGAVLSLQCLADTTYLVSKASLQSGANPQTCTSASGDGAAYTASCSATLVAYGVKQTLFWYADVANTTASASLNIDTLGAMPLLRQDGTPLAPGEIRALTLYRIWYDGSSFRVAEAGSGSNSSGLTDPGANGLLKRIAANATAAAVAGVDFAPPTTGSALLKGDGAGGFANASLQRAIGYVFDGGGALLTPGRTAYIPVPFACTISAWTITADAGTVTMDIWKKSAGTSIPSASDTITASARPALSTGTWLRSTALTGWNTSVSGNDILAINLAAVSNASVASLVLECNQ